MPMFKGIVRDMIFFSGLDYKKYHFNLVYTRCIYIFGCTISRGTKNRG